MDQKTPGSLRLFSGNANRQLAADTAAALGIKLGDRTLEQFNDGEIRCEILENVRDCDVYVMQSTSAPVNEHIMELLVMIDALKRASAKRITAVLPYYAYARQDRKDKQRVPITAKLFADLLETAGADRVVAVHLHSAQIQGFFNIPMDHLYTSNVLLTALEREQREYTVVSADAGGVKRSRVFAQILGGAPLAIIDKRRGEPGEAEVMNIIGDVNGKDCLIAEDMIDTGSTLLPAATALKAAGATSVSVCCTHPVFSKGAKEKLEAAGFDKIILTNSINHDSLTAPSAIFTVVSLAPLLSDAVRSIHEGTSISSLFD